MKILVFTFRLLAALLMAGTLIACGGSSSSSDPGLIPPGNGVEPESSQWDEMIWDEDTWS